MAKVSECIRCEQKKFVNYTGRCKRCEKAVGREEWIVNKARGLI